MSAIIDCKDEVAGPRSKRECLYQKLNNTTIVHWTYPWNEIARRTGAGFSVTIITRELWKRSQLAERLSQSGVCH
eukprot:COSAG02_NODE_521_length_20750_cov_10.721079_10_plen_75_part_00